MLICHWFWVYVLNFMFLSGAFSIDFFEHFNGKHMCIGGAPELKTVEILMKNKELMFSFFFDSLEFEGQMRKSENSEVHLALLY